MYVTEKEVENFMGIAHTDLKADGETMTDQQWHDLVKYYQIGIQDMVHRYCRVKTFDPTSTTALVTEYKSGRGYSDDTSIYVRGSSLHDVSDYDERDYTFYLNHLYYAGTVTTGSTTLTRAPLIVEENTASENAIPIWATRTEQTSLVAGDYRVITEEELTMLRFHASVPRYGRQNIRLTYYTGYDPASDQFKSIKLQILRCFKNFVMLKKKTQEPFTIRAHAVRDFATMFDPFDESHILGDMEKMALEPYRRLVIPGAMFD
jgi:hypothetical protein